VAAFFARMIQPAAVKNRPRRGRVALRTSRGQPPASHPPRPRGRRCRVSSIRTAAANNPLVQVHRPQELHRQRVENAASGPEAARAIFRQAPSVSSETLWQLDRLELFDITTQVQHGIKRFRGRTVREARWGNGPATRRWCAKWPSLRVMV
jgi:hypothetical protein